MYVTTIVFLSQVQSVFFQISDKNITCHITYNFKVSVLLNYPDPEYMIFFHPKINLLITTPVKPPTIAPVEYTSLSRHVPNATFLTFEVQNQLMPNPATAIPG